MNTFTGDDEQGYRMKGMPWLVAKSSSQVAGVDNNERTSPTPAATPVRVIAAVTNTKGLPVYHLNVSQAFVQTPVKEISPCVFLLVMTNSPQKSRGL